MTQTANFPVKRIDKYEMVPPEGGWGYIITFAISVMFVATLVPVSVFGLVYGPYLATLGDETGATTLINGVFNTVFYTTGLPANHFLQKYSYRKVGLIGAVIYFIGTFCTIFATSVNEFIITFGIIQGFGFGFMMPSVFSAFHEYFLLKQNVMMSICQSAIYIAAMLWPNLTIKLMEEYGFRGTVAIFSAWSLNGVMVMTTLQPSKWHYKKKRVSITEMQILAQYDISSKNENDSKTDSIETDQLMRENYLNKTDIEKLEVPKTPDRDEIHSLHKDDGKFYSIVKALDLGLFKDPIYINVTVGVAMAMISDMTFISLIPVVLNSYGFEQSEITFIFTVFFASDLLGRIIMSIVNATFQVWNRYVVLAGALLTIVVRIAYTMNYSFWWITICTSLLGLLRCHIQIPYSLVFAEQFGSRFKTAFTLNMVVCGCTSLFIGVLAGFIKKLTSSDVMVVHLLTAAHALCAFPWLIEVILIKLVSRKDIRLG